MNALLFLYRHVLKQPFPDLDDVERAQRPQRLPTVFTREEAHAVLTQLSDMPALMADLLYGAGLRLMECVRLRVKDVDFAYHQITVRHGKRVKRVPCCPVPARTTPAASGQGATDASGRPRRRSIGKSNGLFHTIAMIQGFCLGGGLAIALMCDLRFASEDSTFGIPAARLGVGYGAQSVGLLQALVGPAYAREILFTGRRFNGDEALHMGLINRLLPNAELASYV